MASDSRGKPLSIQLSWPVAVFVYRNGLKNPGSPYLAFDDGDQWRDGTANTYVRVDAARAWAGFAMWCGFDDDHWDAAMSANYCVGLRDARADCRAWQAFRDFLDGTAEQWIKRHNDSVLRMVFHD